MVWIQIDPAARLASVLTPIVVVERNVLCPLLRLDRWSVFCPGLRLDDDVTQRFYFIEQIIGAGKAGSDVLLKTGEVQAGDAVCSSFCGWMRIPCSRDSCCGTSCLRIRSRCYMSNRPLDGLRV